MGWGELVLFSTLPLKFPLDPTPTAVVDSVHPVGDFTVTDPEYTDEYERALHYSADSATVHHFLTTLASPEHDDTRRGTGDDTIRKVAADALQEHGRDEEAELLRGPGRVRIADGKVQLPLAEPNHFTTVDQPRGGQYRELRDVQTRYSEFNPHQDWDELGDDEQEHWTEMLAHYHGAEVRLAEAEPHVRQLVRENANDHDRPDDYADHVHRLLDDHELDTTEE